MTNKEIIKAISNQTQIHTPLSKGYENFSKGRLVGHLSYWISVTTLQRGKDSKKFKDFWKNQTNQYHYDILELFGINLEYYDLKNSNYELDLGIA